MGVDLSGNPQSNQSSRAELFQAVSTWRELKKSGKTAELSVYLHCAQSLLNLGASLLAYDVAKTGLNRFQKDVKLRLAMGLSLARSNATSEAYRVACELYEEPSTPIGTDAGFRVKVIGLLARVLKDMWQQSRDPKMKDECLSQSMMYYREAYELSIAQGVTDAHWPGINLATLSVAARRHDEAIGIASKVRSHCMHMLEHDDGEDEARFWTLATLGEASLILGEWSSASSTYLAAAQLAYRKRIIGPLCSSARNMKILLEYLNVTDEIRAEIMSGFRPPRVVVFAGHMFDLPHRKRPRLPSSQEEPLSKRIQEKLNGYGPVIGFSSAAFGSDIIFLETLLGPCKGEAYVVLPYDRSGFVTDSVQPGGGPWQSRFEHVLDQAREVITLSPHQLASSGGITYDYSNMILTGLAYLAAQHLECEIRCLAVWDEVPGDGPGGTAAIVGLWKSYGLEVDNLNPRDFGVSKLSDKDSPRERLQLISRESATEPRPREFDRMVLRSLMFVDVKGFSKLTEEQMPAFIEQFYGLLASVVRRSVDKPLITEDRGDGVFCVFDSASRAARFALELNECICQIDWQKKVGRELRVRIGLHSGPVHEFVNPLTGLLACTGTHVSRAARIEPVAPPGQVYASREFAAIATLEGLDLSRTGHPPQFTCVYVGQTEWHKDYGLEPTFQIRRTSLHS